MFSIFVYCQEAQCYQEEVDAIVEHDPPIDGLDSQLNQ